MKYRVLRIGEAYYPQVKSKYFPLWMYLFDNWGTVCYLTQRQAELECERRLKSNQTTKQVVWESDKNCNKVQGGFTVNELYSHDKYRQFHIYVEETLGHGKMYQASAFYNGTFMFKSRMRLTAENAIRDVTLKIDEFWEDDLE